MGDSYIECLVGRDKNQGYYILRIIMFVICGVSAVLALMGIPVMFIVAIAFLKLIMIIHSYGKLIDVWHYKSPHQPFDYPKSALGLAY